MRVGDAQDRSFGTLHLVRHGQTHLNAEGLLRGHLDVPLDETGHHEAKALAELFADVALDVVVTSPLRRAHQTAEVIADANGAPLEKNAAFIDRDYGISAGQPLRVVEARHGSLDRAPEIEPVGSVASRAFFAARKLAGRHSAVLVVAHDAVNRLVVARLAVNIPDDPDAIPQRTGCWNRLEHQEARWHAAVVDAIPGDGHTP